MYQPVCRLRVVNVFSEAFRNRLQMQVLKLWVRADKDRCDNTVSYKCHLSCSLCAESSYAFGVEHLLQQKSVKYTLR